jgi:uncharacterized membrane protein
VRRASRKPASVVWLGAVAFTVVLTALALKRHHDFHSGYDLAIFDQLTWLLGHLHDPFSTVRGREMLADHFEPGLALLAPLGALSAGPGVLLAVQSILLAATAPVLFALGRARGADPVLAAAVAVLWLASPLTHATDLFDFHPEALVPFLFALGIYGLARDRTWVFVVSAIVACSMKEDVALVYAALGVGLAFTARRRLGAVLIGAGLAWFAFATKVGIPAFGGNLNYYSQRFGGGTGSSIGSVLVDLIHHPVASFHRLFARLNVKMIAALVGSTLGLCLLGPEILVAAIPPVAANVLSRYPPQHYLTLHYHIVPAGICATAAAWGIGRLPPLGVRARRAVIVVSAAAVVVFVALSPTIDLVRGRYPRDPGPSPAQASALRAALRLLPAGEVVSVQDEGISHVAERRAVYVFPEPFVKAAGNGETWTPADLLQRAAAVRFVLVDTGSTFPADAAEAARARRMLPRLGFRLVFARDGVRVYRR